MKNFMKYIACGLLMMIVGCYGKKENNFYELATHQLENYKVSVNDIHLPDADTSAVFRMNGGFISFTSKPIVVDAGDKIQIELESKLENGFTPIYEWKMYEMSTGKDPITGQYPPAIELGSTKDLEFNITGSPIEYAVVCTITNGSDGIHDYVGFVFKINKPSGLAILYEGAEGGDFDFIRNPKNTLKQTKNEHYKNMYSSSNGGAYLENPNTLHALKGSWGAPDFFVLINQNNMVSLDYNTFKVKSANTADFFSIGVPEFSQSAFLINGSYMFGVFEGQVYFCSAGFKFKNSIDLKNRYKNMIAANDGSKASYAYYVFFDEGNKKFASGNFNGTLLDFITRPGSKFDLSNTQMDLVYAESGFGKNVNAVMKKGSDLIFAVMDMKVGQKVGDKLQEDASVLTVNTITSLPGLTDKSLWGMSTRAERAFYSSGNKIYLYNQSLNSAGEFATVTGNVTMVKVYKHADESINSKTLYVGTDSNMLYEFEFDVVSGERIGEPTVYEIAGKPINIKYV